MKNIYPINKLNYILPGRTRLSVVQPSTRFSLIVFLSKSFIGLNGFIQRTIYCTQFWRKVYDYNTNAVSHRIAVSRSQLAITVSRAHSARLTAMVFCYLYFFILFAHKKTFTIKKYVTNIIAKTTKP